MTGLEIFGLQLQLVGAGGEVPGFEDQYYFGRRANGFYIPRYRNWGKDKRDYVRGFGYQGGGSRQGWGSLVAELTIGADLKKLAATPGKWTIGMGGFGEVLPYHENKVTINKDKKDINGLPTLLFDAGFKENEKKMRVDMKLDAAVNAKYVSEGLTHAADVMKDPSVTNTFLQACT